MAVTNITITSLATFLFQDTDNRVSGTAAIQVKGASGNIFMLQVDNSLNGAQLTFCKLYDTAGVTVVGTDAPDWIFKVTAGIVQTFPFVPGEAFSAGLRVVCVTTGGTAGTTANGSAVTVRIAYT